MKMDSAVRNRILQLCKERGISINKLANISGMSPSTLKNIMYAKSQSPRIVTVKILCDGLNVTIGEFFNTPEFNNLEQEIE